MDIQKRVKILVAAACVVGVIGVGGAAFTATGITDNAPSTAFIGGTVSQSITGATLSNIGYGFADIANTEMNSVTLTFADATDGATPTVAVTPTDGSVNWSCEAVGATTPDVSTCTASGTPAYQINVQTLGRLSYVRQSNNALCGTSLLPTTIPVSSATSRAAVSMKGSSSWSFEPVTDCQKSA